MKKIIIPIWISFWFLFLEIIYRIFIVGNFISTNTLSVFLFSIFWICFFSIICSLFSQKVNKILVQIFTFIFTLITLAQIVYFNFYDSIFSFFSLTTGTGQVMQFWLMIVEVILRIWYVFLIVIILYVLFLIFNKKCINYKKINKKQILCICIIWLFSLIGISLNIELDNKEIYSLNNLIYKTHAPMLTINKTGLFTMEVIDVNRYFFGFKDKLIINESNKKVINEETYNSLEIDFKKLIDNEEVEDIKMLHEYFSNVQPTEKNEYTGLFKDKNIIFITAEAFDSIAIDESITPTLYKMANNSFIFNNYYQPLFPVSTSDGEYMNLNSLVPKEGTWSFTKSSDISMPFGFGTTFKNNGYNTFGFHNHLYNFYERNKSHTNLGLTFYGCGNGLENVMDCNNWPNSDEEMMDSTMDYYLNNKEPFAIYYMTVSGHLNYNFVTNDMSIKNKDAVNNLDYSKSIKAYYATQIELDKAMEILLNRLEEAGKLDDTLIIIAPDHYPYGLSQNKMNDISKIDRTDKFENYHTSLIMYNPTIKKQTINKVISGMDLLPTIYNLFGIQYDSRLFMGKDIFSDAEHIVILSDRSWITDKGKYNSINNKFVKTTTEEIDENYVTNINSIVSNRFTVSSLILDYDYYSKLEY